MQNTHEIVHIVRGQDALNEDYEKSLYNLLKPESNILERLQSTTVQDIIKAGYSEADFKAQFGHSRDYKTLRRIRHQFWNEYNVACSTKQQYLQTHRIYTGIVSRPTFLKLIRDDLNVAFLLTQPQDVTLIQQDLLYEGYKHLEEVLDLPIKDKHGNVNDKLIGHKIKVIQMLEDRLNGSVVQRTHTFNENASGNNGPQNDQDVAKLREEIANLKKDLGKESIEEAEFKEVK